MKIGALTYSGHKHVRSTLFQLLNTVVVCQRNTISLPREVPFTGIANPNPFFVGIMYSLTVLYEQIGGITIPGRKQSLLLNLESDLF